MVGFDGQEERVAAFEGPIRPSDARSTPARCAFCHGGLRLRQLALASVCAACGVAVHADCARGLTRCATLGCRGHLPGVRPRSVALPRPAGPGALLVGAALVGLIGLVAWRIWPPATSAAPTPTAALVTERARDERGVDDARAAEAPADPARAVEAADPALEAALVARPGARVAPRVASVRPSARDGALDRFVRGRALAARLWVTLTLGALATGPSDAASAIARGEALRRGQRDRANDRLARRIERPLAEPPRRAVGPRRRHGRGEALRRHERLAELKARVRELEVREDELERELAASAGLPPARRVATR